MNNGSNNNQCENKNSVQRSRGGTGGSGPPPPENLQATVFLSNTGPDSLENHIATKPAFNVAPFNWSSSSLRLPPNLCAMHHHRETIKSNLHYMYVDETKKNAFDSQTIRAKETASWATVAQAIVITRIRHKPTDESCFEKIIGAFPLERPTGFLDSACINPLYTNGFFFLV